MPDAENKRAKAREVIDILEDISKLLVRAMIPSLDSTPIPPHHDSRVQMMYEDFKTNENLEHQPEPHGAVAVRVSD